MSNKVNAATGEILEDTPKFRCMWCNPFGIETQDCSDPYQEVFEEIPAYAVDPKTGEFLNKGSNPILISKGKINVQERIQSFAKETDLYSILEKFAYGGDPVLINARDCSYADLSDLPNDLNGFSQYCKNNFKLLNNMNPELAKMVVDDNFTAEDIEAKAKEILNSRIEASKASEDKGGNE